MKKKFFSYLLTAALMLTQVSVFAEGETTEDTNTGTETTDIVTYTLSPENYATIYLQTDGYHTKSRTINVYYNTLYTANAYIYTEHGSIISSYKIPAKTALTNMTVSYNTAKGSGITTSRYIPIVYDTNKFGIDASAGVYASDSNEYAAVKAYTENYWCATGTTSHSMSGKNFANQIAEKITSTATGYNAYDVTLTALAAFLADTDEKYLTFATAREVSGFPDSALGLKTEAAIPKLTLTYSKSGLLNSINSTSSTDIADLLSDLNELGLFAETANGYEGYSRLVGVAKEYVENTLYKTIANGGFADFETFYTAYDEAVAYASANGTLIAINGVKSEPEMKAMLEELGEAGSLEASATKFIGYTALSSIMKNQIVKGLYEVVAADGFESVEAFLAEYDTLVTAAATASSEAAITAEIAPENYAAIHITDEGYHGYSRDEAVYYNTPYSENAKLYAESGSVITSYKVPLKESLEGMSVNYSINTAGAMHNGYVPVFYDINKFAVDVPAGKYLMVAEETPTETPSEEPTETPTEEVSVASVSETTDGGLDEDEEEGSGDIIDIPTDGEGEEEEVTTDVYGTVRDYTANYWPASGYSYTNSKVAYRITSTSTGRIAHDVTSTAMKAFVDTPDAEYLTFATGRETSGYINFSVNVNTEATIPTLTLKYSAARIVDYINSAENAQSIEGILATLDEAGILSASSLYGYAGYTGVGEKYKAQILETVYEEIAAGGYIKFSDFIEKYDSAVLFVANNIINNPDTYISFNDQTAKDISGNGNDATLVGDVEFSAGPDGSKALKITNTFGKTAQQYLNMGEYDLSEDSFSIVFWMKARDRGIEYEQTAERIANGTIVDFSTYTGTKGGVVLSNKDFSVNDNTGFAFAAMPVFADFSFNMKLGENSVSNTVGIQTAVDSRWHQISYVVNRAGKASFYVDNVLIKETDISKLTGSMGVGDIIFGADGLGQYGMNKGEFDDIRIYSSALEASKIEELYYKTALDKLNNDVEVLLEGENASLYSEENITALEEKLAESKAFVENYEVGNLTSMIEQYNAFDEYFNLFLNKDVKGVAAWGSDVHISEPSETHLNAQNLKRFLTESEGWENPAKSFILSGDLADVGADDLRYFFGFLDKWVVEGSNMAICRGNHDEPVGSEKDTGISYTRTQLKDKYVAWMDKYVDKNLTYNKGVVNEEGNLAQPFYYSTDGAAHYLSVDIYWPTSKSISDTEIAWLKSVLDTISGDGKPIFFIQHNPLYGTHPTVETDKNQLSKEADTKIKNLVKDYDNVFILTGHHHESYATGSGNPFKVKLDDGTETGVWLLNTTVLCSKTISRGYEWAGGYYINIYDDKVVFRARDFENQKWLRDYDMTFELKAATRNVMGDVKLFDTTDGTEYSDVASAVGKTVKVQAPVGMVSGDKLYDSIFAVYSDSGLLNVKLGDVTSDEMYVTFEMTIPEGAVSAKLMVWENISNLKPVFEFASID